MRVHNCLIITSSDSRIELTLDELRDFSGNLVVNEAFLGNWIKAISCWQGVSKALADSEESHLAASSAARAW